MIYYPINIMNIYKGLKNGPINKKYTFLEREDHVECKYIIRNEFGIFQNTKIGG